MRVRALGVAATALVLATGCGTGGRPDVAAIEARVEADELARITSPGGPAPDPTLVAAIRRTRCAPADRFPVRCATDPRDGPVTRTEVRAVEDDRLVAVRRTGTLTVPGPPVAVAARGPQVVERYERGREVLAQQGCLACHQLGTSGQNGPGPPLTDVGGRLAPRIIAEVLQLPVTPMPSYAGLCEEDLEDFAALVTYLAGQGGQRAPSHRDVRCVGSSSG